MNKIPAAKPKGISNKVKANESQDEARMVVKMKGHSQDQQHLPHNPSHYKNKVIINNQSYFTGLHATIMELEKSHI